MKKISVYYWSPFLTPIATCKAVINSAFSIEKFGNNHESYILNFFNEFSLFRNEIKKKNIKIINKLENQKNYFQKSDITILAIPGIAGLKPTIELIKKSKKVLIANKESIICGWNLINKELKNIIQILYQLTLSTFQFGLYYKIINQTILIRFILQRQVALF